MQKVDTTKGFTPVKKIDADGGGIYNIKKHTSYRIVVSVADVNIALSEDRAVFGPLDIKLPVGVHFIHTDHFRFMKADTPANMNVIEIK